MPGARRLALFALATVASALACGDDPAPSVLQPLDLKRAEGEAGPFDRNSVVDPAAFTDSETLDVVAIQRFFGKTPYERPSFLETYQSNGVRAADAIVSTSRKYQLNPLVFLVYAEITQGLVGERNYPFPPDRVEYVFRCGCLAEGRCLPSLAGFDRQVDCLGRALRKSIDEIKANETTVTGWGPEVVSLTLDGLKVTPDSDATAAIYDRTPRVAEGRGGGTWIFWNVWNLYTLKLDYFGPIGVSVGRWIGEGCTTDAMCSAVDGAICADNYPDGLCTVKCKGECPSDPTRPESFCARFPEAGYCLPICNPAAPTCRPGYECKRVAGVGSGDAAHVCTFEPGG